MFQAARKSKLLLWNLGLMRYDTLYFCTVRSGHAGNWGDRSGREFSERLVATSETRTSDESGRTFLRRVRQGFGRRFAQL